MENSKNGREGGGMLRKGTWTEEEDNLLRNCIQSYGEGRWHLVPGRAGLNRCRKSCRLRWLNYLKPDIKRGQFDKDEVDLIIRLHKLLGNRWTLIAGRIPGRTANDIKNFWNSHIMNKHPRVIGNTTQGSIVIQPQFWKLCANCYQPNHGMADEEAENDACPNKKKQPSDENYERIKWWTDLLEMASTNDKLECNGQVAPVEGGEANGFDDFLIQKDFGELLNFNYDDICSWFEPKFGLELGSSSKSGSEM